MDIEGLTMDREVRRLRDDFVPPELSRLLYNGLYFSPELAVIKAALDASQSTVNGSVKVKVYKGGVWVEGRESEEGLYDQRQSSMDELGGLDPRDSEGFIKVQSIRLKKWGAAVQAKGGSFRP